MGVILSKPRIRNRVLIDRAKFEIGGDIIISTSQDRTLDVDPNTNSKKSVDDLPRFDNQDPDIEIDEIDTREIQYGQVKSKYITLEGSWLGNVSGTMEIQSAKFKRNVQMFLKIEKESEVELLLELDSDKRRNLNVKVFVFKKPNDGFILEKFQEKDIFWESPLFMTSMTFKINFPVYKDPYVMVVTHSRSLEGGYILHLESDKEIVFRVRRNFCEFFQKEIIKHELTLSGSWKGKTAGGAPPGFSSRRRVIIEDDDGTMPSTSSALKKILTPIKKHVNKDATQKELLDGKKDEEDEDEGERSDIEDEEDEFVKISGSMSLPRKGKMPKSFGLSLNLEKIKKKKKKKKSFGSWLNNTQFPLIANKFTKCYITLTRTSPNPLTMGIYILKLDPINSSSEEEDPSELPLVKKDFSKTKYFTKQMVEDFNLVAKHYDYSCEKEIILRTLLPPSEDPYIFIPLTQEKGREGTFELKIESNEPIFKLKHDKVEKMFEEKGVWMERTCGGRPNRKETSFFNSPQFFLTIKFAHDSPYKPEEGKFIYAYLSIEQDVPVGEHMPIGFYVIRGGGKVTKKNWDENKVTQEKIPQYKKTISSDLRLTDGVSYTIIPYPKINNYAIDKKFIIRIKTHLPSDTKIEFERCPDNDNLFADLEDFAQTNARGKWKYLTSGGGDHVKNPSFFNNPQFYLEIKSKTKMNVVLKRMGSNWLPIGVFIVQLYGIRENRITFLKHFDPEKMDLKGPKQHRIIDKIDFTNGIPNEITKNFILPCGSYVLLCCSQMKGMESEFLLSLKTHKKVRLTRLPDIETKTESIHGGFIGGQNTINQRNKNFFNNPSHILLICQQSNPRAKNRKQDVIIILEQPMNQNVSMCLFLIDGSGKVAKKSSISNSRKMTISAYLKPGKYNICIGIEHGKEGEYSLTVQSSPMGKMSEKDYEVEGGKKFFVLKRDKINDVYFGEKELGMTTDSIPMEGKGILGPVPNDVDYTNIEYVFSVEKGELKAQVEIKINNREVNSVGFVIRKVNNRKIVYNSGPFRITDRNGISLKRRFILESEKNVDKAIYSIEIYPGKVSDYINGSLRIRCNKVIDIERVEKELETKIVTSRWNFGRESSPDCSSERFLFNPSWELKVEQDCTINYKIERPLSDSSLGELHDDIIIEEFDEISEGDLEKNDTKVGIFVLHSQGKKNVSDFKNISFSKDVYVFTGWKMNGKCFLMHKFKASDDPYFIIPVATNPKIDSQFTMFVHSKKNVLFKATNEYQLFQRKKEFETIKVIECNFNYFGGIDKNWKENAVVELNFHESAFFKIGLYLENVVRKVGFSVISKIDGKLAPILNDNIVHSDSIIAYQSTTLMKLFLDASKCPYYIVPQSKSRINDKFKFMIRSTTSFDSKLLKGVDGGRKVKKKLLTFYGGWNYGVDGGFPKGRKIRKGTFNTFKNNPYIIFSLKSEQKIFIHIKSRQIKFLRIYIVIKEGEIYREIPLDDSGNVSFICKKGNTKLVFTIIPSNSFGDFEMKVYGNEELFVAKVNKMVNEIKTKNEFGLRGKWDPSMHFGAIALSSIEGGAKKLQTTDWQDNPNIQLEIKHDNALLIVTLVHNEKVFQTISFMVKKQIKSKGNNKAEFDYVDVYSPPFVPFKTKVTSQLYLTKGTYVIIPLIETNEELLEVGYTYPFYVNLAANEEIYFESELVNVEEIDSQKSPKCDFFSFDLFNVTNNVKAITTMECEKKKFASSLVVYGPSVYPILMGMSSSFKKLKDNLSSGEKKRMLFRHDKMGVSNKNFVDVLQPIVGAGNFGKGKIVVIGDTQMFSKYNIQKSDNRTFLLNIAEFVIKKLYKNVEYSGGGLRRGSFDSLKKLNPSSPNSGQNSNTNPVVPSPLHPNSPRVSQQSTIQLYCSSSYSEKSLIPFEDLRRAECRIALLTNFCPEQIKKNASAFFFIFDEEEELDVAALDKVSKLVHDGGCGLVVLSKCSKHGSRIVKDSNGKEIVVTYPANYLLHQIGITIGEVECVSNNEHEHDKFWWISRMGKNKLLSQNILKKQKVIMSECKYEMDSSYNPFDFHASSCLEMFLFFQRGGFGSNASPKEKEMVKKLKPQIAHVIEQACWSIPPNDLFLFPFLVKEFCDVHKFVDKHNAIRQYNSSERFTIALNTNLYFNANKTLVKRLKCSSKIKEEVKILKKKRSWENVIGRDFVLDLSKNERMYSTSIYARKNEIIKLSFPKEIMEWEGEKIKVVIGMKLPNLWWIRDFKLKRYPLMFVEKNVVEKEIQLENNFGGLIYIEIPEAFFQEKEMKKLKCTIWGGTDSVQYTLGRTQFEEFEKALETTTSPYCEFFASHLAVTLPIKEAKLLTKNEPKCFVSFWNEAVKLLHNFCHGLNKNNSVLKKGIPLSPSKKNMKQLKKDSFSRSYGNLKVDDMSKLDVNPLIQKLVCDQQVPVGSSFGGIPVCILEGGIWEDLISNCDVKESGIKKKKNNFSKKKNYLSLWRILREFAFNLHKSKDYIWNNRMEAVINISIIKVLDDLLNIGFKESEKFKSYLKIVKEKMLNTTKSMEDKKMERKQSLQISTMFELILISEFGWEPFEALFFKFGKKKSSDKLLSNQDKIDQWVVDYSLIVNKDITGYYNLFGINVSQTAKTRVKHLQKWVPLF